MWRLVHHYRRQQGRRTGRGSSEIVGGYEIGAWVESSLYFEPIGRTHRATVSVQSKAAPSVLKLILPSRACRLSSRPSRATRA